LRRWEKIFRLKKRAIAGMAQTAILSGEAGGQACGEKGKVPKPE